MSVSFEFCVLYNILRIGSFNVKILFSNIFKNSQFIKGHQYKM